MKKFVISCAILTVAIFSSCSKNDSTEVLTHHYNATLRVTVSDADSILAGAKVDVYVNKDDRDNVVTPDFTKSTNVDGIAEFDNLDTNYYYLRVTNPKTQAVKKDETKTVYCEET